MTLKAGKPAAPLALSAGAVQPCWRGVWWQSGGCISAVPLAHCLLRRCADAEAARSGVNLAVQDRAAHAKRASSGDSASATGAPRARRVLHMGGIAAGTGSGSGHHEEPDIDMPDPEEPATDDSDSDEAEGNNIYYPSKSKGASLPMLASIKILAPKTPWVQVWRGESTNVLGRLRLHVLRLRRLPACPRQMKGLLRPDVTGILHEVSCVSPARRISISLPCSAAGGEKGEGEGSMKELVGVSHVSPPPSAFASAQPPRSVFADAQAPPSDSEPEPDSARSRRGAADLAPHPKAAQACRPLP